jgi:glycosyltransferase involved in cell wall biosynthesis
MRGHREGHVPSGYLRVGIDGRSFTSPAAGVRRYVSSLVPALQAVDPRLELIALGGERDAVPAGLAHVEEPWHPPTNLGWSTVGLPRAAARAQVDVIHAPAYTAPLWSSAPVVLTIHDVSYERHPEWYPYQRDVVRRLFYRGSARAAAHVLTDSEFSATEIAAAYQIPRERITVAPLGVSEHFAPVDRPSDAPLTHGLPAGITSPFLLHVGDLHERRNLPAVVHAMFEAQRRPGMPPLSLVLAGVDRGIGDRLRAYAREADAPEAVICLGPVTDVQLLTLYRAAAALVYPSRYEGFGLPVVEAMACGTPVLASRAASIPEVLGDAGVLLDPDDEPGWADAITRVIGDEWERGRMRTAGLNRAKAFTWARTASITLDVYRHTAQRKPGRSETTATRQQ